MLSYRRKSLPLLPLRLEQVTFAETMVLKRTGAFSPFSTIILRQCVGLTRNSGSGLEPSGQPKKLGIFLVHHNTDAFSSFVAVEAVALPAAPNSKVFYVLSVSL